MAWVFTGKTRLLDYIPTLTALPLCCIESLGIRSLVFRIHQICSPNKIKSQLAKVRLFTSWSDFSKRLANKLIDQKNYSLTMVTQSDVQDDNNNIPTIWVNVPLSANLVDALTTKTSISISNTNPPKSCATPTPRTEHPSSTSPTWFTRSLALDVMPVTSAKWSRPCRKNSRTGWLRLK